MSRKLERAINGALAGIESEGGACGWTGTNAGPGTGYAVGPGMGPQQPSAGASTGSGTAKVIGGKLQHAAGMLLSSDSMKALGLERENQGIAEREENNTRNSEREAMARRERADEFGSHSSNTSLRGAEARAMNMTLK